MTTEMGMSKSRSWAIVALLAASSLAVAAGADDKQVARGKYLVNLAGCTDCHTPGYFLGKPDASRFLAGSDVGFRIPGAGTFVGRNLTPDKDTGIGGWTIDQIITAFTTGVRPDGRILAPVMPWAHYAELETSDKRAIAVYLKTLPPVRRLVPGPFGANEEPQTLTWTITQPRPPVP
jgi:mono/diheme cytochrome c family protein